MPRNDDGEYELVLGNRQLLSGFFFVVVLFGIFFTMGYFVGRHSSAGTVAANQGTPATQPATAAPLSTTPPEPSGAVPAPGKAEVVSAETPAPKSSAEPPVTRPVETKPAKSEPAPPAAKPVTPPASSPAPAGSLRVTNPSPGDIYLQVSAPAPAAAESVVAALKQKGITSIIAPGPDAATVRVLVGPLVPADIPTTRTQLESAGFKPFVRKY